MELKDKNVLITGSTRGIGLAIAHKFASLGANIILNGRGEVSEDVLAEFKDYPVKVFAVIGDVSDSADAKRMVEEATLAMGSVDVLVNNAGITKDGLMLRMTEAQWDAVIGVNLKSAFNFIHACTPIMMRQRGGSIINMASVVGVHGNAGQANYAASKAGIIGFTKSIAKELASRNITANAVAPGFIQTDMTNVLKDEVKEAIEGTIPLKRLGTAEDVAKVVRFLASDDSNYITGQVINVDGGMLM